MIRTWHFKKGSMHAQAENSDINRYYHLNQGNNLNNPVYVVNQNGLMEIEPQVNSINGIFEMNTDEKIESITLSPEAGSMVYLSTDGFADQPGQKTNKKLYSAGFEKLLTQIQQLPLIEQKEKLAAFFIEWKGNLKQHDDILVMGVRV